MARFTRLARFALRVVKRFMAKKGLLLAGGVCYNLLLSLIPLAAVTVSVVSLAIDEQRVLDTVALELRLLVPRHADSLVDAVQAFLASREVAGTVGFLVLLFVSSLAFRMLEDAIDVIFEDVHTRQRHAFVSVLIPYAYMVVLGTALAALTVITAALDAMKTPDVTVFGWSLSLQQAGGRALYALGFAGLVILFSSVYKVLPRVQVGWWRSLAGGLVAATLWTATSRVLVYYFTHLSFINVIYGSLASVVVVLIGLEVLTVIVLLGAQVIAELERSAAAGLPWYEAPPL